LSFILKIKRKTKPAITFRFEKYELASSKKVKMSTSTLRKLLVLVEKAKELLVKESDWKAFEFREV
jgi:hypothetical protein